MKRIILAVAIALLSALSANATGTVHPVPVPKPNVTATASANAAGDSTSSSQSVGSPVDSSLRMYNLPGGGSVTFPAIACIDLTWRKYLFGVYEAGDQHPNFECLKMAADLERLRSLPPAPPAKPVIMTDPYDDPLPQRQRPRSDGLNAIVLERFSVNTECQLAQALNGAASAPKKKPPAAKPPKAAPSAPEGCKR